MALKKGTYGIDTLSGTASADIIYGYFGSDTLNGLGGNDRIFGGNGNDKINGGAGNDYLFGGAGRDTLNGGDGNDVIDTSGQLLFSFGGETDIDTVNAGKGDDTVTIEAKDIALGGAGRDLLILRDTDVFSSKNIQLDFSVIGGSTAKAVGKAGTSFATTKAGQFEGVIYYSSGADVGSKVVGSNGDDAITLSVAGFGATPGITIFGGGGNDTITGSAMNDTLKGDAGNDIISGGFNFDTLTGGAGQDAFLFHMESATGSDADRILDFSLADDIIAVGVAKGTAFGSASSMLLKGSNPTNATTAAGVAQFLYNTTTGALSIDKNGSTADGVELIATLANKANITLSHLSIEVSDLFVA